MPTPYYLTPKATKLPEGHDDTLDPPEPATDPEVRSRPPEDWPVASAARGGTEPPDGPLAPPPTPPARRTLPPLEWPLVADTARLAPDDSVLIPVPGDVPRWIIGPTPRQLVEHVGDLDPDIAMWPRTIVQRWPFTGPPASGIWPKGWLGVDNTATLYICTVGGEPGTWAPLGGQAGPPGPQGPPGATGPQGVPGINGAAAGFGTPTAVGLPAGQQPLISASGPDTAKIFSFGIPAGATGAQGATGPQGPPAPNPFPNILRAAFGPPTQLGAQPTGTPILGSNPGALPDVVTQVGRRYRITASVQGFNATSTVTLVGANLFRDGVQVASIDQFYGAGLNQFFIGTRMWLEDGDGSPHLWQVVSQSNAGATCTFPANQTTLTVEDLGPNFNN